MSLSFQLTLTTTGHNLYKLQSKLRIHLVDAWVINPQKNLTGETVNAIKQLNTMYCIYCKIRF